jgi:hypothetical protein
MYPRCVREQEERRKRKRGEPRYRTDGRFAAKSAALLHQGNRIGPMAAVDPEKIDVFVEHQKLSGNEDNGR